MFIKSDDYKKITVITYPDGNVLRSSKHSYDFDNGARVVEKYLAESEKFKKASIEAQSNISENATLSDDTLKITIEVDEFSYTFSSAAGFPNIAFVKAIGRMGKGQLSKLSERFMNRGVNEYPSMNEFQNWIAEICDNDKSLDVAFKAYVNLHDSYTKEHISAIKYIINSMAEQVTEEEGRLVVVSADPDLKNAIIDLGMSTYFDIEIEE